MATIGEVICTFTVDTSGVEREFALLAARYRVPANVQMVLGGDSAYELPARSRMHAAYRRRTKRRGRRG